MIPRALFTSVAKSITRRATARRPEHRIHLLFGANTDVGKSVISAGLIRAAASSLSVATSATLGLSPSVNYIKPLQCGGSDEAFILDQYPKNNKNDDGYEQLHIACQTLYSWDTPASPHLASRLEDLPVSNDEVLASLRSTIARIDDDDREGEGNNISIVTIIETAGGALSPSSSSPLNENSDTLGVGHWGWTTQADLYASLDLPAVFVGDGKLGGIGVTLASLEALWSRGYRIDAVVFVESGDAGVDIQFGRSNADALREYVSMNKHYRDSSSILDDDSIICLPPLPHMPLPLSDWYESNQGKFMKLHRLLCERWKNSFSK